MPPQFMPNWYSFEHLIRKVLSQQLKVNKITRNANLAGHQVDFYVEAESDTGKIIKTAVEVKYSEFPIVAKTVVEFNRIISFLSSNNIIDRGILISYKGFTEAATKQARNRRVDLVPFDLLEKEEANYGSIEKFVDNARKELPPKSEGKLIFVLMPFTKELKDLYVYGIRGAAEKTGYVCRRADEIEHNSDILKEVLYYIENADILVAEVTENNPNVYYEVGIAHGKNKNVVLLTKEGNAIPFDLQGKNHIIYDGINDLENKLVNRLKGAEKN